MAVTCPYLLDPATQQHVRQKVARLKRLGRHHSFDEDDLKQHFTWDIQRAWHQYDHSRQSWYPFLRMILARESASLLRSWNRQKRRGSISTGDEMATMMESSRLRHRHVQTLEERERLQLRLDVIKVVARLPHRLREVAAALPDHSISSLARELHLDRGTIRARMAQIRHRFEKAFLQDYLDSPNDHEKA